jgi:hypothetical protein
LVSSTPAAGCSRDAALALERRQPADQRGILAAQPSVLAANQRDLGRHRREYRPQRPDPLEERRV